MRRCSALLSPACSQVGTHKKENTERGDGRRGEWRRKEEKGRRKEGGRKRREKERGKEKRKSVHSAVGVPGHRCSSEDDMDCVHMIWIWNPYVIRGEGKIISSLKPLPSYTV